MPQVPPLQVATPLPPTGGGQLLPQVLQLFTSVSVSTQLLLHLVYPPLQVKPQLEPAQLAEAFAFDVVHWLLQFPQ
jgi:hypothetical protein